MSRLGRTRSARSASRNQEVSQSPAGDTGWMTQGEGILEQAKKEREKPRTTGSNANRFWLKDEEQREIVILDAKIEDCVAFHEHHMRDPITGKWNLYEGCPKEWETCPVCEIHGESYYAMFVSVLDLTPFLVNKGKQNEKEIPCSRRLLVIKSSQIPEFHRLMTSCIEENGTMRGLNLLLRREGDKSARIGKPIPIDGKSMYDFISEEDLIAEFGHDEVKGKDGVVYKQKNEDLMPFDYGTMFEKPSGKRLREIYGGNAPAGSDESNDEWSEDRKPTRGRSSRRSRRVTDEDIEDEEDDVEFENPF